MGDGWYLGMRKPGGVGRVFGGQVIAQALAAAQDTVGSERIAHSLHAYFMRAGDENYEITFRVERDFDGGSFSTRRIIALQKDRPILNMAASFQKLEAGFEHQIDMPDVPPPESLEPENELRKRIVDSIPVEHRENFVRERPFEHRPCNPRDWLGGEIRNPAIQNIWFKLRGSIGDDKAMHRSMLVYASDSWLLGTCTLPHGVRWETPGFVSASLDHAVWLHDDFRVDEWLLYSCDSPWAGRGRGFNRGSIYTRDGRLVATCAQEGLIRMREPKQ
ncbi:acyl-CoA thioesterase II [Sphingorhabdus pulchriflava]|uniref:Acyl-CoA thioesterase 2 n=2 Tax=Sphingorhabdus pulchriflava TaxID=2292257 RepID=A0A371BJJ8_9SPHN|nr:acyl-CoA thioesterase II [Sphingorhabdus pulchriflava]